MYLSPKGRDYKQKIAELISDHRPPIENAIAGRLSVFLSLSSATRRAYDIDNRVKPLLDALQDAGVFEDDGQIDSITVLRHPPGGNYCNIVICEEESCQ